MHTGQQHSAVFTDGSSAIRACSSRSWASGVNDLQKDVTHRVHIAGQCHVPCRLTPLPSLRNACLAVGGLMQGPPAISSSSCGPKRGPACRIVALRSSILQPASACGGGGGWRGGALGCCSGGQLVPSSVLVQDAVSFKLMLTMTRASRGRGTLKRMAPPVSDVG